jgi:hypothetical protein
MMCTIISGRPLKFNAMWTYRTLLDADEEATLAEAAEQARRTGEHRAVVKRTVLGGWYDDKSIPGRRIFAAEGVVWFFNLTVTGEDGHVRDRHLYDYRVSIGFDRETVRHVVTELTAMRRPDGPDITARGLQGDRVGEVERAALNHVLGGGLPETTVAVMLDDNAIGDDEVVKPKRGRPVDVLTDARLLEVARVCAEARAAGRSEGPAILAAFDDCINPSTGRNWKAKAKARFPELWG